MKSDVREHAGDPKDGVHNLSIFLNKKK